MKDLDILIAYFGRGVGGIQVKIVDLIDEFKDRGTCYGLLIRNTGGMFDDLDRHKDSIYTPHLPASVTSILPLAIYTVKTIFRTRPKKILAFSDHTAIFFLLAKLFLRQNMGDVYVSEDIFLSNYLNKQPLGRLRSALVSRLYALSTKIFVMSEEHKDDLIYTYGLPEDRMIVVDNWLPRKIGEMIPDSLTDRRIDILFVGRIEYQKNLKKFVDVVHAVATIMERPITARIVGNGTLMNKVKKYSASRDMKKTIYFEGYKNNPEKYYRSSKVFLLTSLFEGQPLVFLEAMACGTPVVTFIYDGVEKIIQDRINGLVVRSVSQAARQVAKLLSDSTYWTRFSKAGYARSRSSRDNIFSFINELEIYEKRDTKKN